MRALRVVKHPPLFDQYLCFSERVDQLPVKQLISELAVKRFTVTVLPWAARGDVNRFGAQAAQPAPKLLRNHLRAVARSNMLGNAVGLHQVSKDIEGIPQYRLIQSRVDHELFQSGIFPLQIFRLLAWETCMPPYSLRQR
jgi:hypothetical protein